jgi:hypothetical protein
MSKELLDDISKALDIWASRFLPREKAFVPQAVIEKLREQLEQARPRLNGDIETLIGRLSAWSKLEDGLDSELDCDTNRKILTLMIANRNSMSTFGPSLLDHASKRFKELWTRIIPFFSLLCALMSNGRPTSSTLRVSAQLVTWREPGQHQSHVVVPRLP